VQQASERQKHPQQRDISIFYSLLHDFVVQQQVEEVEFGLSMLWCVTEL